MKTNKVKDIVLVAVLSISILTIENTFAEINNTEECLCGTGNIEQVENTLKKHNQEIFLNGLSEETREYYKNTLELRTKIDPITKDKANTIVRKIVNQSTLSTNGLTRNKLKEELSKSEELRAQVITNTESIDMLDYIILRLKFKISIYEELNKVDFRMNFADRKNIKNFTDNIIAKYFNETYLEKMFQYERLLGISLNIQEKLKIITLTTISNTRAQNFLKYIEIKMYEELEKLDTK